MHDILHTLFIHDAKICVFTLDKTHFPYCNILDPPLVSELVYIEKILLRPAETLHKSVHLHPVPDTLLFHS